MAITDKTLQEGIQAVKGGNFERARRLFSLVVEEDPDSELGWYWLGLIAPDQDKRIACFLRALEINPANQEARDRLTRLGVPIPAALDVPGLSASANPLDANPLDDEETGPLPTAQAYSEVGKYSQPGHAEDIFQPLEEEEKPAASPSGPSVFQAQVYGDPDLGDLDEEEAALFSENPKPRSSILGRLLPVLVILLIIACASTIFLGVQGGGLPFGLALAPASATPTITPTPRPTSTSIPTQTPLPSPTATPVLPTETPTPTLSAMDSLASLNSLFEAAAGLQQGGQYNEAIQAWEQVIAAAPQFSGGYYGRGRSYLAQATHSRPLPEDAHALLQHALEDLNQAIALGPPRGSYYQTSYQILDWLAQLESFRSERQLILEQMLADVRTAAQFGLTDPFERPNPGSVMLRLGRCGEALEYFGQQVGASPASAEPASLYADLARVYLCFGQLRGASLYASMAHSVEPTPEREWIRAITLYNLGRYNETLVVLNDLLEANPDAPGDHYFLRALVRIQRREYDFAQVDLDSGSQRTLDQAQLGAYASALLARQAGDEAGAQALFNLAEETISLEYGLVLDRVRAELGLAAPERGIPTLPDAIANYLDEPPAAFQPAALLHEPDDILLPVRYDGSGPFHLANAERLGLHLYPPVPLEILFVDSLTLSLAAGPEADFSNIHSAMWDFSQGAWVPLGLAAGDNPVGEPSRFVNPRGDIYLRLENQSGQTLALDNLNLILVIAGQQESASP